MDPQLLEYIRQQRAAGLQDETTKQNLLTNGWALADVESALSGNQPQAIVFVPANNKAKIALIIGLITLMPQFLGSVLPSMVQLFFINGSVLLAVVGLIFAIWGFRAHKGMASIAIVLCLISIASFILYLQFIYQVAGYMAD